MPQLYNRHILCNYNNQRFSASLEYRMSTQSKIDELERLLNNEEEIPMQILPNGEIRRAGTATAGDLGNKKPLTMKENLGGEY
jgi:hypothetical protein